MSFTSTKAITVTKEWAAFGHGWAVHGKTEEEAVELYREAVERHREIDVRAVEGSEEVSIL